MAVLGLTVFGLIRLGNSFQSVTQEKDDKVRKLDDGVREHGKGRDFLPGEREALVLLREIARSKDKGRIQEVLKRIDHESERVRRVAALAAGRLAAHEGRGKLEKLSHGREDKEDVAGAKIALARLHAESGGADATGKVRDFLSTLGISTTQLNRWAGAVRPTDLGPSFATMILREIADMVAEANRHGENTDALEREIEFEADYFSALKVRLSKMSQSQRIAFLIRNIRTLHPTRERSYDVQALADEGNAAVPAIIAALKEIHDNMKRDPSWNRAHNGAAGKLMRTLACIGDSRALPILQAYVNQPGTLYGEPDRFTRSYAEFATRYIKEGRSYYEVLDD